VLRIRRPRPSTPSVAVAGTGPTAVVHALAARAAGVDVLAVAGDDRAATDQLARDSGAHAVAFDDLPAGAEAVIVASPLARRGADTARALGAGAAVAVEPPLAATLAQADRLVAAEVAGATVVYAENLLAAPVVSEATAIAQRLGDLRFIEARALAPRPSTPHADRAGGVLFELGAHPIALALLLAGPVAPIAVQAVLSVGEGSDVDDHAEVEVRFASGLLARVEASWRHQAPVWDLQASSDTGVVRADLAPTVGLEHDGEPVALPVVPRDVEPHLVELGYVEQVRAIARIAGATSPTEPVWGAAFGRAVLEVVSAAYASARSAEPVGLPFEGPRDVTPLALWRS
jgi:myo-inositol 2-dehydrogenase/D-chiro-inositol 1-dehydrogenase